MNRILIIGNGFDRAHGLRTGYDHFLLDYVVKTFYGKTNDGLLKIARGRDTFNYLMPKNLESLTLLKLKNDLEQHRYSIEHNSELFRSIWNTALDNSVPINWFNIERIYYNLLINNHRQSFGHPKLLKLNADLEKIKQALTKYLLELDKITVSPISELQRIITENLRSGWETESTAWNKITNAYAFNFNYTSTFKRLYSHTNLTEFQIHGQIDSLDSIVFGYGDELDKDYKEIEETQNNDFLKNIKSFKYFNNGIYQKLTEIINQDIFEVYVLGHSLGNSDRTLLSQIFSSDKLESVKIFYHENKSDYDEKIFNISRHFSNKVRLRTKIVPFPDSSKFPQYE